MAQIDSLTSLAFSIATSKGRYGLLLGAGISYSSGIPTGWAITQKLVRQFAELSDVETSEPEEWYKENHGDPSYSFLLENLFPSQEDRHAYLRSQIEPNEEERENGEKIPTPAHEAIAELIASGYVRVVVTTNFDQLLEQALRARGVEPTVIFNEDSAKGALPYVHSDCTIVKIHGDYLDTRSLNTSEELDTYPEAMNSLLDRLFDEFGWIVCGWSGEWDHALRQAWLRSPGRRFATYWTHLDAPAERAQQIVDHRDALKVRIEGADTFFTELREKVLALDSTATRHPLTSEELVARVKRYSAERRHRIKLFDLVAEERHRVLEMTSYEAFSWQVSPSSELLTERLGAFDEICRPLADAIVHGIRWAEQWSLPIWLKTVERLANPPRPNGYQNYWAKFARYPALLSFYAAGVVCVSESDWEKLSALLASPRMLGKATDEVDCSLSFGLRANEVISREVLATQKYVPGSEHLCDTVKSIVSPYIDLSTYEDSFNRFEYFVALDSIWRYKGSAPIGRFGYIIPRYPDNPKTWLDEEISFRGESLPLLNGGLFNGQFSDLQTARKQLDEQIAALHW